MRHNNINNRLAAGQPSPAAPLSRILISTFTRNAAIPSGPLETPAAQENT